MTHSMRSNTVKRGFESAWHRRLHNATGTMHGVGDAENPFDDACTGNHDPIPGHVHLHACGQRARAGSVPFALHTILRNTLQRS